MFFQHGLDLFRFDRLREKIIPPCFETFFSVILEGSSCKGDDGNVIAVLLFEFADGLGLVIFDMITVARFRNLLRRSEADAE